MHGIEPLDLNSVFYAETMPSKELAPHATLPPGERGTRSLDNPNDTARWLALADKALSRGASDDEVAETETLARKEQAAIRREIQHRAGRVNQQSKSKQ